VSSQKANYENLEELTPEIVKCEKCPRLRAYAKVVASEKPSRFADWTYWAKPVPGFGDPNARLLIIGIAPAATGGLRTGRIFTGDASSKFLVTALNSAGYASQAISESRDDGLAYSDCYLTAAVKCAPPGDRPTPEEFANCSPYLDAEISILKNLKSVLALGSLSFKAYLSILRQKGVDVTGLEFSHGKVYRFKGEPTLYASYHPSPRNTNTGVLTQDMLRMVLKAIKSDIGSAKDSVKAQRTNHTR
jgi:uracil-DNA glycosylase family 4